MSELPEGVSYLTPVVAVAHVERIEQMAEAIEDSSARQEDAYWWRFVRGPYTPQRFIDWWVARRWIIPRDIRKR